MQGENQGKTTDERNGVRSENERRKRINHMKYSIMVIVLILLILPTLCCIYLGLKVTRLQNQVSDLLIMHGKNESLYDYGENYAFAAEYSVAESEENMEQKASHVYESPNSTDNITVDEGKKEAVPAAQDTEEPSSIEEAGQESSKDQKDTDNVQIEDNQTQDNQTGDNQTQDNQIEDNQTQDNQTGDNQTQDNQIGDNQTDNKLVTENALNETNKTDKVNDKNSTDKDKNPQTKEKGSYVGKTVYLTFDDGPSIYTDDILDILDEYQVKATFFVVGKTDTYSKKMYQRILDEGHSLGMHSYSHVYKQIYNSLEDFDKDFTKLWKLLYDTTGYKPTIYRFPGGSANLVNKNGMDDFITYLNDKGMVYYDWNVDNGDATGVVYTKDQLIDNVLDGIDIKKRSIVLMHDFETKKATKEALPELLEILISQGAQILPLDKDVAPIQQIKFDSVK